jgi:hypothetical protein
MSGEAGGLILIPVVAAAALPIVGLALVGGAIYAGASAASRAANNYEERQRQRREAIRQSGIGESIGSFRSSVAMNMNEQLRLNTEASNRMMQEIERNRRAMIEMAQSNDPEKYHQYMGQIRTSRQQLSNELFSIQDNFVKNYQVQIAESMNNVTRTIDNQYAMFLGELQQFQNDLVAKKNRARQIADQYIEEAKTLIASLEEDFEGQKFSGGQLLEIQRQLNDAIGQYNLENYEGALATAKDASLAALEEIYKADCKKQEWDNYYKLALTISSELSAYLEAQAVVTEEAKKQAEAATGKPLEEEIVGIKISDYTDKMKDGKSQYEYLVEKTEEIKKFLESDDAKNLTTQQLKEYVEMLNGKLYPSATLAIYKAVLNMSNAFSRQNISEEIIDFFEDHNFTFKGYNYDEDQHDNALHIGLENEATGEEIIVTLAPQLMENGEVQTRVQIDQLCGDEANEERKAFYRASVEDVVVNSTPGAQIKLECRKETRNRLSQNTGLRDKLKS